MTTSKGWKMLPDHCPEPSMASPLRDSPGSPTRRARLRLLSPACAQRAITSSATADHPTGRGIGLLILRHLIWSCLLLPHETAGGKVGPFLPEEEKTEAGGGEVGGAEIRLAPGAWRHPKL